LRTTSSKSLGPREYEEEPIAKLGTGVHFALASLFFFFLTFFFPRHFQRSESPADWSLACSEQNEPLRRDARWQAAPRRAMFHVFVLRPRLPYAGECTSHLYDSGHALGSYFAHVALCRVRLHRLSVTFVSVDGVRVVLVDGVRVVLVDGVLEQRQKGMCCHCCALPALYGRSDESGTMGSTEMV
jgi:hypothetical protein